MPIFQLENKKPIIDKSVYIAYDANVIGDVKIGKGSSIWFKTTVRGDVDAISIGEKTNVQDLSMLHVDKDCPLTIGNEVTIGHLCIVHGCTIEDNCLIGMGATVMNGVKVGRGSIIAAGAVVLENTIIPPFSLVVGVPAKIKATLDESVLEKTNAPVKIYYDRAKEYNNPNILKQI